MPGETFPLKVILVNGFPYKPPRVYVDKQLTQAVVHNKAYLGHQNEVTIPYLRQWSMGNQSNLKDVI